MEIKKFTPSQVQKRPADLYRTVESEGKAIISHRDREDMIVIKKSELMSEFNKYFNLGSKRGTVGIEFID